MSNVAFDVVLDAVLVVATAIAISLVWRRVGPGREAELSARVASLEAQVHTLLDDRARDQQEIMMLRAELAEARMQIRQMKVELERQGGGAVVLSSTRSSGILLVVLGGAEKMFQRDLAQLRQAVRCTAHRLLVIPRATKPLIEAVVDENRAAGTPIWGVHFGGHARADGLLLEDGLADGQWLSETFGGTEVLVLAGCETFAAATWAGVVPVRVSVLDQLETRAASIFTGAFWAPLCRGMDAQAAFDEALTRSPSRVAEYVQLLR